MRFAVSLIVVAFAATACTVFTDTDLPEPIGENPNLRGIGEACNVGSQCAAGSCVAQRCVDDGFVFVVPGTFSMGQTTVEDAFSTETERPVHDVTLTLGFAMMETELTAETWFSVPSNTCNPTDTDLCFRACDFDVQNPRSAGNCCPVTNINWYEALEFANRLSVDRGLEPCYELLDCTGEFIGERPPVAGAASLRCDALNIEPFSCGTVRWNGELNCGYRLPTEAEWEYAVREAGARTGPIYRNPESFEVDPETLRSAALDAVAVYRGNSNQARVEVQPGVFAGRGIDCQSWTEQQGVWTTGDACAPLNIMTREPNQLGLYDMLGNVEEWCWDAGAVYTAAAKEDPRRDSPTSAANPRIVRGGSFNDTAVENRMSARDNQPAESRSAARGVRYVRSARRP